MTAIAFLGKDEITDAERDLLETFGFYLAEEGNGLHISSIKGANGAIARGWTKSSGHRPKLHAKGLHRAAPELVLYVNAPHLAQILAALPLDGPRMTIINTPDQLQLVCEIALGVIAERDCTE